MARTRLTLAHAKATGAIDKNPKRFRERREPASAPLGKPPATLNAQEREAWEAFRKELPWLRQADRAALELASAVRARVLSDPGSGTKMRALLRSLLVDLGATPTSRSKILLPGDDDDEDPAERFIN